MQKCHLFNIFSKSSCHFFTIFDFFRLQTDNHKNDEFTPFRILCYDNHMKEERKNQLSQALTTAFIDTSVDSNLALKPRFLYNRPEEGQKVISSLEEDLLSCDEFAISVAFITMGGIVPLLQTFRELEKRGVKGRILTTDYLNFSEPRALLKLHELSNVDIRMYRVKDGGKGFHTKGYIFRSDDLYKIIIGSSNLTQSAITINHEWNTKLVSTAQGEMAESIVSEFEALWDSRESRTFEEFYDEYKTKYEVIAKQREIAAKEQVVPLDAARLEPNKMQVGFITRLKELISDGADKALLISATGTGKTYASAFGIRDAIKPSGKVLFIVHRKEILKQARDSYRKVFGSGVKMAMLTGDDKDYERIEQSDFLFAMVTMISKPEVYERFSKNEFEVITLDEAHHSTANSYQKVIEYFKPRFLLGMTATPERTDKFNVFEMFDYNIAYEIRLQQAMEEDLLCPFHYFGITDFEVDGETIDEETKLRNFRYLVSDDRVDYVLKQSEYYGYSGKRVRGLIFCSSVKEAKELSERFNERGLRTLALSGDNTPEERENAIERLANDDRWDRLDYILTVNIFNEGVDIPEINQIIMLRPTESAIVFVQQLGRGLRKRIGKEYTVIIDCIANYKNNFLIPIALSGDRSYNKDNVRRYLMEGNRVIPGCSTVHFDEISKKRIFSAIDTVNFSDIKLIKQNYKNLKDKLGKIPSLMDFDRYGEMDVLRIFDNNSLGSYYKFLVKYEPEYTVRISETQEKIIEFISRKIANGKRIHEVELLALMLKERQSLMKKLKDKLQVDYRIEINKDIYENVVNVMTNEFPSGSGKTSYKECVFLERDGGDYRLSASFVRMLEDNDFYDMVKELVEFGRYRYERDYSSRYQDTDLVLYQKYTYEDVCRLLGWEHNEVATNIGGYKFDKKTKTLPVFINYHKSEEVQDTVNYKDRFVAENRLIAISKNKRKIQSPDVQNFLHAKERGIDVELFVRKNKDDKISKEFYYLGRMTATGRTKEFIMPNTTSSAVEIEWLLDTPVRNDIYEYITNG